MDNLFFFSSRRRHTRFDCDWSSDVCSSDLICSHDMTRNEAATTEAAGAIRQYDPAQLDRISIAVNRAMDRIRSEEHTSELQSQSNLVCRLLLEKKKNNRGTSRK